MVVWTFVFWDLTSCRLVDIYRLLRSFIKRRRNLEDAYDWPSSTLWFVYSYLLARTTFQVWRNMIVGVFSSKPMGKNNFGSQWSSVRHATNLLPNHSRWLGSFVASTGNYIPHFPHSSISSSSSSSSSSSMALQSNVDLHLLNGLLQVCSLFELLNL